MPMPAKEIYTVSRLAFEARGAIEKQFPLLWIEGEISNLSRPASGHLYFTLKDKQAQVRCALFRNRVRQLGTEPENGKQVLIRARVTLYEGRSEFQILVEQIEVAGEGRLLQELEALKTKLRLEGLFADDHKKPLPTYPGTIALITSPVGAAVRDLLITLERRYPMANILLFPSPVQGKDAAEQLCKKITQADSMSAIELIILARGGGSIEDLQAFNDEQLVRTLFRCQVPIVVGVGHESDWTLADLVADLRAATPTAAAELATPDQQQLQKQFSLLRENLDSALTRRLNNDQQRLDSHRRRLLHPGEKLRRVSEQLAYNWQFLKQLQRSFTQSCVSKLQRVENALIYRSPQRLIDHHNEHLGQLVGALDRAINSTITNRNQATGQMAAALTVLNPLATLARGYAVVRDAKTHQVLTSGVQIQPKDQLQIQLRDARVNCTVETIEPLEQENPS